VIGAVQGGVLAVKAFFTFGRLFLVPVKSNVLPEQIRVQPVW
jgi:magnesium-protoporphyrin IX monomethyl ester (oxidative) cyclase